MPRSCPGAGNRTVQGGDGRAEKEEPRTGRSRGDAEVRREGVREALKGSEPLDGV